MWACCGVICCGRIVDVSSLEMDMVTQVQIPDETLCISHSANNPGKRYNSNYPSAMGKEKSRLSSLLLVRQPVEEKENSDFNLLYHLKIGLVSAFTNPSARTGSDTRSIFKRSLTGLNSEFSFSKTGCLTKTEEPSLPYYLSIAEGIIIGFILFPRVLELCEIQSASSRILNSCRRAHFLRR